MNAEPAMLILKLHVERGPILVPIYLVDDKLGRLIDNRSVESKLHLKCLHALT